jgi:PAS domain S-box-containing protein
MTAQSVASVRPGEPMVAPRPLDERARLAALRRYRLLDHDVVAQLQPILRLAVLVSGAPQATVNVIDAARQWQIAAVGVDCVDVDRDSAMCSRTILHDEILHIPDASTHPWFQHNPFVTGERGNVRMYVGVPLMTADGYALGTLCVTADRPTTLTEPQVTCLRDLGGQIVALFELHRQRERAELVRDQHVADALDAAEAQHQLRDLLDAAEDGLLALDADDRCAYANLTGAGLLGYEPADLLGRDLHELIHSLHAIGSPSDTAECRILQAINSGPGQGHAVEVFWTRDGTPLPVRYSMVASARQGEHTGVMISFAALSAEEARARALDPESVALRRAIEGQELVLVYQPKICLATGRCAGVEALVRWRHPRMGWLTPDRFIPLAESNGLIIPLTAWVAVEAIRQCRTWRDQGLDLSIAINISPQSLFDVDLRATVGRALTAYGVPTSCIGIELTETAVAKQPQRTATLLKRMAASGFEVAIDDFGTGYGALTYLRDFPVSVIKIDKSFVGRLRHSARDAVIVRSTIALAHSLGQTVVAEGVEDPVTADLLQAYGCDQAQGYLWSRPLLPDELALWARQGPCFESDPAILQDPVVRRTGAPPAARAAPDAPYSTHLPNSCAPSHTHQVKELQCES